MHQTHLTQRNFSSQGSRSSHSPAETESLGESFARQLEPGAVVALFGPLGAGKTAFVRGLARGLCCVGEVCSPTYALVHEYTAPGLTLAHFDMYRVGSWEELESTGYYDYLARGCTMAIEWSENIAAALPPDAWRVTIEPIDESSRAITITKGDA